MRKEFISIRDRDDKLTGEVIVYITAQQKEISLVNHLEKILDENGYRNTLGTEYDGFEKIISYIIFPSEKAEFNDSYRIGKEAAQEILDQAYYSAA